MRILTESQVLRRYGDMEQYLLASEILKRNFNDHSTLVQILREVKSDSVCWYLYNGLESTPEFVSLQKKHKADLIKDKPQLFPVYISLLGDEEFIEIVRNYFKENNKWRRSCIPYYLKPIQYRLEKSDKITNTFFKILNETDHPNEIINVLELLKAMNFERAKLKMWIKNRFEDKRNFENLYDVGYDYFLKEYTTVYNRLYKISESLLN
jgi:hypothetical protein